MYISLLFLLLKYEIIVYFRHKYRITLQKYNIKGTSNDGENAMNQCGLWILTLVLWVYMMCCATMYERLSGNILIS